MPPTYSRSKRLAMAIYKTSLITESKHATCFLERMSYVMSEEERKAGETTVVLPLFQQTIAELTGTGVVI